MATTYTTNYNLGKQENHADKFDMDVITDNADKIDAALTAKADKSTTYTKTEVDTALSGKQATLTTAQLDAVNSGITSADVTQIGVNENNISYNTNALKECVDNGAKNKFNPNGTPSAANMVYNGDGTYTVTKTTTGEVVFMYDTFRIDAGTYILSGCPANGGASTIIVDIRSDDGAVIGEQDLGAGATVTIPSTGTYRLSIRFGSGYTASGLVIKPMLCDPALWTISPTFEPYAMNNAELTAAIQALQAQLNQ